MTESMQFRIGGELAVRRLGFGAMRLTGPGVWGPPEDVGAAKAVLRRAVDLGVNFIDTADVYGPGDNERLIREALAPYPAGLVIATKGGLVRSGPASRENPGFSMDGSPAHLRAAVEGSLRDLGLERIDLYQLHRIDPGVPVEESLGALEDLKREGKIGHIGLSEVTIADLERARAVAEIATVQNIYNLQHRRHDDVLAYCTRAGIGFIPFWPLHAGDLARSTQMGAAMARIGASAAQVALAWLLQRSPNLILIPGTASLAHLEENLDAAGVELTPAEVAELDGLGEGAS